MNLRATRDLAAGMTAPSWLLALPCLAALWLAACATTDSGVGRYVVTAPKSAFYKYGPAQAFGADFTVPRGQRVTVTKHSFGFSAVTTDDGVAGYLATDDLAPIPPEPAPASRPKLAARRPRPGRTDIEVGNPLFDSVGSDLPLPSDAGPSKSGAKKPAFAAPAPKVN